MKYGLFLALCAIFLVSLSCKSDDPTAPPPVVGTIEVVTVTTGLIIDGDGYTVTVSAGGDERTEDIGTNSTFTLSNLTAGTKALLLDDISLNCQTVDNPRNVEVVAGQTTTAQFDVACANPPLPPIADAGPNQAVVDFDNSGSEDVTLDGSGSMDVDGTIASWSWAVAGAEIGTGETLAVSVSVGSYVVLLTVTDDLGNTSTDDVLITVIPTGNQPPIANAGPNQPVLDVDDNGSEVVTLDGSRSADLDGTITNWSWAEGSAAIGTGETLDATFGVGIHVVTLIVTDNGGATDPDSVVITVISTGGNFPPVADAGSDQTVEDSDATGSTPVRLDGSRSMDLDGTIASWSWSENGVDIGTGETLITPFTLGVHTVLLTVTDDGGATATDDVTITVGLPTLTGVFIYQNHSFNGDAFILRNDTPDLSDLFGPCQTTWDDCISSIQLSDGWSAILYEDVEYQGERIVVVTTIGDLTDLGGAIDWDNNTSSIRIIPPGQ